MPLHLPEDFKQAMLKSLVDSMDGVFFRKDGETFMRFDQIVLSNHPETKNLRVEYRWNNKPLYWLDVPGPGLGDPGNSVTLQGLTGSILVNLSD